MKNWFFAVTWLFTLAIAYWAGLSQSESLTSGQSPKPSKYPTAVKPTEASILMDDRTDTPGFPQGEELGSSPSVTLQPVASEEVSQGSRGQSPAERLLSSNPVERLQAFTEILKSPTADSIRLARDAYESLPGGPGRFSELKVLAYAWGQVAPTDALNWAKEQQHWDEHVASGAIMSGWAQVDAGSAISWAKENFEGEDNPYFIGIISGLSETDLPRATDLMTELPYGRIRGRSAHILFEKAWSMGEDMAIHWAENLPEGSLQNFAYGELGEKVAREDMNRAVDWLNSMEESEIKVAVSEDVSREMVRKDVNQAAEWANSLPEGNSKTKAVEEIVKFWAKEDPLQAANWAESLPAGPSKITAMNEVAEKWSSQDPVGTADWINQIPADVNKDPLIETLVNKIHKTDPESALTWAETISSPERRKFMTELVERSVKKEKFSDGR